MLVVAWIACASCEGSTAPDLLQSRSFIPRDTDPALEAVMNFLKNWEPVTLLLLRLGLAVVFAYHGFPKLFGETARFVESFQAIGLPASFVYIAGTIEFFGGVAIALGLFTPIAGVLLLLDMAAAMWKYNFNEGIYAVREYELPLILGLASLAVAAAGGGPWSLDRVIFRKGDVSGGQAS
jgi:putative oxidoreductase